MGRHAALEESTVSPPRSDLRALRDLADETPRTAAGAVGAPGSAPAGRMDGISVGAPGAAPGNRPAVHTRPAVGAGGGSAVNAQTAVSAADLIARFRSSGLTNPSPVRAVALDRPAQLGRPAQLDRLAQLDRPARAEVQRVKAPAAPLRVSELVARHPHLLNEPRTGHRAGSHRPTAASRAGMLSRSVVRVLPALRPEPSIRVAVRPVLTAAAIITAVGLIEAPNLLATSHLAAGAQAASTVSTDVTAVGIGAGAVALADPPHGVLPATVATTASAPTPQRVSRATRRALPAKAAATHVPVMKPGQTVAGTWIRPSTGRYTSCFCARWGSFHAGIDLASPLGTPIVAVGDGVVIKAGPASGFGNWVVIQHANGDVSIYGHMKYFFVHVGQKVKAGEKIAVVGDQGFSTGPHLHFEIHQGGFTGPKINPIPWLKARGIVIGPLSSDG